MSTYKNIHISDFTYSLPEERIARYPLEERDHSQLLIWQNGGIKKEVFKNITNYIPNNSMLVFNNTRVIHARVFFRKESGAKIEIFCLEPAQPADYLRSFEQTERVVWKCMLGNAKKWKEGFLSRVITVSGKTTTLIAKKVGQRENIFIIEFQWDHGFTFAEIIEKAGTLPIPPYLNRETEPGDEDSYQTIYARMDGSVAAPTAGLHFTDRVLKNLAEKKVSLNELTLHVGAGTFQPVKTESISDHTMHNEKVIIPATFIEALISQPEKIIAVGTTSVRSLESLYWLGVKLGNSTDWENEPIVAQWDPYELSGDLSPQKALKNILSFLEQTQKSTLQFSTQLIIVPGYSFRLINGMITNFHQPQSTLLLLISAFLGDNWKDVYRFALENEFRFLSYGDSNLYLK